MARTRYQKGMVFLRGTKEKVWIGRWREDVIQSDASTHRVYRSINLGPEREPGTKKPVTEKMALRRLEPILARINSTEYRPVRTATVREFAERWQAEVLTHRKPSTVKAAASHLRVYILPQLGSRRLDELGRETQQQFITRLVVTVSRKTAMNVFGTLSTMLNTAKAWGYITDPIRLGALALPEEPLRAAVRFFSGEEARNIIAEAREPYRTMFSVLALTGIRAGELLGLQVDDLDFERRIIQVRRSVWCGRVQTVKSKASRAPVAIPEALVTILRQYLVSWHPNPEEFVFINRMGRPYNVNRVVQRGLWPVLERLKIAHCGLHAFRHTHTSLLLEVGAPPTVAQAQLRHSDARITLGVYGHVIGDSQRNAVERVAKLLGLHPDAPKSEPSGEWIH